MADRSAIDVCPYCRESIQAGATKCTHCSSGIERLTSPDHAGVCPYCREKIHPEALKCPHCKSALVAELMDPGWPTAFPGPTALPGESERQVGPEGSLPFPGVGRLKCHWELETKTWWGPSSIGYPGNIPTQHKVNYWRLVCTIE